MLADSFSSSVWARYWRKVVARVFASLYAAVAVGAVAVNVSRSLVVVLTATLYVFRNCGTVSCTPSFCMLS